METPPTRQVDDVITLAANLNCPILISGQSALQREAIARLIHREGQFVRADCATLNEVVFESLLDPACGGTLFVDEIGAMSPWMQARFSRFVEQQARRRLEATSRSNSGEVRIIAGSDEGLMSSIAAKQFSPTLFYRLNLIHIQVSELGMMAKST